MQKDKDGKRAAPDKASQRGRSKAASGGEPRLKRKAYETELRKLHVELVKLQEWVRHEAQKICIVFEGRDGAGKGGVIKAITARVSPRVFRVVAFARAD
jgi:polyphosphate kinase 2 (PPK2 family)